MINIILCIFFMSTFVWAECNEGEVELWPDYPYGGCFNIETTTSIDFDYYVNINDVIPPEIGQLVNLEYLDLSGAAFPNYNGGLGLTGGIPPEIGNLTNLTYLNLSGNPLGGSIPDELGNLINLNELHLESNELEGEIPIK